MVSKTFNVGVVGYGMSAKIFHIPFISQTPSLRLHAIVQRNPREGNSAPTDHPSARHFSDVKDLLADADTDVIVITTPPDQHFALTKAALESGKHVLTEKPFVPTAAEAEELIALSEAKGRLICVFQNRRWDADFLTVKHLLEKETLGRILEFNSHFDRYKAPSAAARADWKGRLGIPQAGSTLYDLGTHLIDQAYVLFGLPRSVRGRLINQKEGKALDDFSPDAVTVELSYPDGKTANLRMSALSVETSQPRFWVRGIKGAFHKYNLDPQEDQLKAGALPGSAGFGKDDPENLKLTLADDQGNVKDVPAPDLEPETYTAFYAAFADALASGAPDKVPVKASEARDVLKIIEAVLESARSGRDVTF
ncbi:Homoserine dehydrogenase [Geosmithia morbida]|uniref:Homoserine dehydrogenase n=1 Tax=Geosmithia morbida TaxID=1094350 RepID=A0A9P4YSW0_9HYPO|nr:Homoserine dehydrogenase [Geosmithia morbida]KAF4121917.1 Homoserine dehydrogenase [Geosmithia morbida]